MSIDETIKASFLEHLAKWKQHCEDVSHSSRASDYVNCDAYRAIVQMGKPVLPLIRIEYSAADEDRAFCSPYGWSQAIREITGVDVDIPERERGRIEKIRTRYVRFLDEYLSRNGAQ